MKKQLLLPIAVLAVGMVATPTLVSARRGADDGASTVRQEDRREDRREDRAVPVTPITSVAPSATNTSVEDNPNSVDANGADLRGDGTPEDNNTSQQTTSNVSSNSSSSSNSTNLTNLTNSTSSSNGSVSATSVTREQAVVIANNTLPGRTLKKVESEEEHGVKAWSVRFNDGSRVDVNQADGTVTRVRQR